MTWSTLAADGIDDDTTLMGADICNGCDEMVDIECVLEQGIASTSYRSLQQHAIDVASRGCTLDNSLVRLVYLRWLRWFHALNMETAHGDHMRVSWTDVGFVALCSAWVCLDPIRYAVDAFGVQEIANTYARLVVISCQHTSHSRHAWPSLSAWHELKRHIAHVVQRHYQHGPKGRLRLIALMESTQLQPLADDVVEAFSECQMPDTLRLALAASRMRERRAKEGGGHGFIRPVALEPSAAEGIEQVNGLNETSNAIKDDVSEEAAGSLWRNSSIELVNNYIRIASRVSAKVDTDNALVERYSMLEVKTSSRNLNTLSSNSLISSKVDLQLTPTITNGLKSMKAPRFTPQTFERVGIWIRSKCRIEQTEEMTKLFRDISNEWWLPIGTETHRYRNRDTRSDVVASLQQLEGEIGVHLGQHMHDRSLTRLTLLSDAYGVESNPDSIFGDSLLLSLFAYACKQRVRFDFLARYVMTSAHHRSSQRILDDTSLDIIKRPLIVVLQRRWWLFHRQQLLPCSSMTHALLAWLYTIANEFDGETEQEEDITELIEFFINSDSIQL